jgi:hypothetical protein
VYFDSPMCRLWHTLKIAKPPLCVGIRIGMRESVCEVTPDFAVVSKPNKRSLVASRPAANYAVCAFEPQRHLSFGRLTRCA